MIRLATEFKVRAERKCGQMLIDAKGKEEIAIQGGDRKSKSHDTTLKKPTLKDLGISKDHRRSKPEHLIKFFFSYIDRH